MAMGGNDITVLTGKKEICVKNPNRLSFGRRRKTDAYRSGVAAESKDFGIAAL
jgi:hypothetical protein